MLPAMVGADAEMRRWTGGESDQRDVLGVAALSAGTKTRQVVASVILSPILGAVNI